MRKAWEDMKPLRIWASQERLHHTKTMETNTNNWVHVTQPETNVLDLIQTTSNHAKHVCGLWGNWLGSVKRQGFPTKQELKPQRPWLKLDRADLIGKLGHKKIKKRTTVSLWFKQNAIRQYYLIVSMSSVPWSKHGTWVVVIHLILGILIICMWILIICLMVKPFFGRTTRFLTMAQMMSNGQGNNAGTFVWNSKKSW